MEAHVLEHLRVRQEALVALAAAMRPLARVDAVVAHQGAGLHEAFAAEGAGVAYPRFLFQVALHVRREAAQALEGLAAVGAHVWPLLAVHHLVSRQLHQRVEALAALVAQVPPLPLPLPARLLAMDASVQPELGGRREAPGALLAGKGPFACVGPHVPHQRAELGEALLTVGARVGAADIVRFQVVPAEAAQLGERLLAHGALHGAHQRMDLLVARKLAGVREAAAALGASQRVIAPVAALVLAQVVQSSKGLLALAAFVPSLGGFASLPVGPYVSLEVSEKGKRLATRAADQRTLGRDELLWLGVKFGTVFLVLLQFKRIAETLATL